MKDTNMLFRGRKKLNTTNADEGSLASRRQYRMTRQKRRVLDILRGTKGHPTAEWIYMQARESIPSISLGTVYRNLQALRRDGYIQEHNYGKAQSRFDGDAFLHYHFICERCGAVLDVMDMPLLSYDETLIPGKVRTHRLEFYGICDSCDKASAE